MVKPLIATFQAAAVPIAKGQAVTVDSTGELVTVASATTSESIGIAQNAVVNVNDLCEVALSGGGAKGLANSTIAAGDFLGQNANGKLQKVANANDRIIGIAMQSAVAGDIFQVMVIISQCVVTQS